MYTTQQTNYWSHPLNNQQAAVYKKAWTRWMRQHLHDDPGGRYVAFTLTTRFSRRKLERRIKERCGPGTFFYLLPAVSYMGMLHYHGLIRFPSSEMGSVDGWIEVEISDDSVPFPIKVPAVLNHLLWNQRTDNTGSTFGNLNLRHDGAKVEILTHGGHTANSVLTYWEKTNDGELRDFTAGDFVPFDHRKGIPVRKGRPPRPKPLRVA